ncbi:MAG: MSMEG_1061 family FMN-dependent PPOX-type flavoprotein [Actinomycetota bacterium]
MSNDAITDRAALRTVYREATEGIANKARPTVDAASADFLARSTLMVFATTSDTGTDASPRGGPAGFLKVLDDGTRVAFADLSGNNRLDSFTNILDHPQVGILAIVPGAEETVRINGHASLSLDEGMLDLTAIDGKRPKVAVVVDIDECFMHCGKALRRAGVWQPETWPGNDDVPSAGALINSAYELGGDDAVVELIDADLEANYVATLWEPGATGDNAADT